MISESLRLVPACFSFYSDDFIAEVQNSLTVGNDDSGGVFQLGKQSADYLFGLLIH
jgi:hypothetical protein